MEGYLFKLPDLGEGAAEAEIAAWHVAVGDTVAEDQPLVDVLTDKATIEIPWPVTGTVVSLYGEPGEKRAVGSDLVRFDVARDPRAPNFAATLAEPVTSQQLVETPAAASVGSHDKPSAAPAVRRRARDLGIELKYVNTPDISTSLTARLRASGSTCFSPPIRRRRRLRLSTAATGR